MQGRGYDGASNMHGVVNGLQTLFLKECPYAYYVHCTAHHLQLALVAASSCSYLASLKAMDAQANIKREAVSSLIRYVRTLAQECESYDKDGVTEGFGFVKELISSCNQALEMDMTGPDNARSEQPENAIPTEEKAIATEVSSVIDNLRSTEERKRMQGAVGLRSIYKSHVRIEEVLLEDCIRSLVDFLNCEFEGVQNEAVATILDISKGSDVRDTHWTAECKIFLTNLVPALWKKLERASSFDKPLILALRNICTCCEIYYRGPSFLVQTMEARGLDILLKSKSSEDVSFLIGYICDELVFSLTQLSERKKSVQTLLYYSVRHKELRNAIVESKYVDFIIEAAGKHRIGYEALREDAMTLLINIHGDLWKAILSICDRLNLKTLPALAHAVARYDSKTESESTVSDPLIIVKALDRLLNCLFVPSGIEVLARLYEHAVFSKKLASTKKSCLAKVHDKLLSSLNYCDGLEWCVSEGRGREVVQVLLSIHRLSSKQKQQQQQGCIKGIIELVCRAYVETGQDVRDIAPLVEEFKMMASPAPDAKSLEMETYTRGQQNPMNKESIIQVCGLPSMPDIRWEKEKLPLFRSPGLRNNQKSAKAGLKRSNTILSFIPEHSLLKSPSSVISMETKV